MRKGPRAEYQEIFLEEGLESRVKRETLLLGTPHPPCRFKCHDGSGAYKTCLQNLEPQGFRGKNLENKVLETPLRPLPGSPTASPSSIMAERAIPAQVRCHTGNLRSVKAG